MSNTIFDIEQKQDSAERLEAVQGIETKFVLFADEFNDVARKAVESAIENVQMDLSWSNKDEHRVQDWDGVDWTQLLVMNFRAQWMLDNTDEVWLMIDRYKMKRAVRTTTTEKKRFHLILYNYTNSADVVTIIRNYTNLSNEAANALIQNLPSDIFVTENYDLALEFASKMTNVHATVKIEQEIIQVEKKLNQSGFKHDIYPDLENPKRPSEIQITNEEMVLEFGQRYYFTIDEFNRIRARGYGTRNCKGDHKAWVYLQFRVKVKKGNKIFYSKPKQTIKMMCNRDDNKITISYKLV